MVDDVNDLVPRTDYVASAAQEEFDFPWPILHADHLVVLVDGVVVDTYTVAGVGDDEGGTITMDDPMVGGEEVVLYRATALERLSDIPTNNGMRSATVNNELDKLYLILQEIRLKLSRSIQRLIGDVDDDAPSWDADDGQLKNLADGTDPQDAVTVAQLAEVAGGGLSPGSVDLDVIEQIADQTVLLNVSGAPAAPIAGNLTQLRTLLGQTAAGTSMVTAANAAAQRTLLDVYTTAQVDALVVGLLDFKGSLDCSANPNYPVALKGDAYMVSVAGRVGGGSGKIVSVGDVVFSILDNAGGTEASVGTSWDVLEANIPGLTAAGIALIDDANAAAQRVTIGLADDALEFVIGNGVDVLTPGLFVDIVVPFDCTINTGTLLCKESGSVVVDFFKCSFADYEVGVHPVSGDKITASAPLTVSTDEKVQDAVLTGWTLGLTKGQILRAYINSATTVKQVTAALQVTK
jgi:hypothetical protein